MPDDAREAERARWQTGACLRHRRFGRSCGVRPPVRHTARRIRQSFWRTLSRFDPRQESWRGTKLEALRELPLASPCLPSEAECASEEFLAPLAFANGTVNGILSSPGACAPGLAGEFRTFGRHTVIPSLMNLETMMQLSDAQRLAVETVGKNVCVSAGAGSGKTRVLVERFIHLVKNHNISPANILAITFTEKAANEMKRRIVQRLREENLEEARREVENAPIGTIHSFAARLLREHPVEAGVDPKFRILESAEAELLQERVLDETIEALAADPEVFRLLRLYKEDSVRKGILSVYSDSRNSEIPFETQLRKRALVDRSALEAKIKQGLGSFSAKDLASLKELHAGISLRGKQKETLKPVKDAVEDLIRIELEEKWLGLRDIFIRAALQFEKAYQAAKQADAVLDFDDLQFLAVRLLGSKTPAARALQKIYQNKFQEIMVDEFQDTNHLQDRLLELVRRESNLFVVGDFKQSIYSFRGTRVEIFLEKEKNFAASPAGIRIPLAENYRSEPGVIGFINSFFETLWREDGIPFEPLLATRPHVESGSKVDWIALPAGEDENAEDLRIREACALACHVRRLVDEEGFSYKDIACLFRATSDIHLYEYEFRRADIPYFVVSSGGFYAQPEIKDCISFLSVLENPRRDIPLAAVLRSPFFQVSDDTLFWLARRAKQEKRETPLIQGVLAFESIPEISAPEKSKLDFFTQTFQRFLKEKEKQRISELIEEILRVTGYDLYVLKSRQGDRGFANLRKLMEIARELESKETLHLGEFISTIKGLQTRDVRESQAQVEAEDAQVVKLLTIHMAKGLEFPVVVIPDLGRKKNAEKEAFILSGEEGLGFKAPDDEFEKLKGPITFYRNKKRHEQIQSEESKRLLYVAMTRARERLVFSGPHKGADPKKETFHSLGTWSEWVDRILDPSSPSHPEGQRPEGSRILRFAQDDASVRLLRPDGVRNDRGTSRKPFAERKPIRSRIETFRPIPLRGIPEGLDLLLENCTPLEKKPFPRIDLPVSAFLLFAKDPEEYFLRYEIGILDTRRPSSILEVKEEEDLEEEEEILTSAEFGTRVHLLLEQILVRRLGGPQRDLLTAKFTQDLSEKEKIEISAIIQRFMEGERGQEILKSKTFYPELAFTLRLAHGLVNGKIDLIYQNPAGDWIVLDYKTSQANKENFEKLAEEYRIQLELYSAALRQILGISPTQARIEFLRPGLSYSIPMDQTFEALLEKFAGIQKAILEFRQSKIPLTP